MWCKLGKSSKVLVSFILAGIYFIFKRNDAGVSFLNEVTMVDDSTVPKNANTTKYVLFYTPFYELEFWSFWKITVDNQYFIDHNCPVTTCVLTRNKSLLPSVDLFDAIVFHIVGPHVFKWPKFRRPHQQYIAAGNESPLNYHRSINLDNFAFNWIMNYRLDSDIVWVYGIVENITTGERIAPAANPQWIAENRNFFNATYMEQANKKSKFAASLVSNCDTQSRREALIAILRWYINVDVFGKCAGQNKEHQLKCPRSSALDTDSCNQLLEDEYKFYFAFENSLCEDYVTEKLFRTMSLLIVPVVYGGANYTRFAPPHSYIDANKFKSPKSLAKYLLFLDSHPEEYIKYFWWKEHYRVRPDDGISNCDLCEKISEQTLKPVTNADYKTYSNLTSWLFTKCTEPRIKF